MSRYHTFNHMRNIFYSCTPRITLNCLNRDLTLQLQTSRWSDRLATHALGRRSSAAHTPSRGERCRRIARRFNRPRHTHPLAAGTGASLQGGLIGLVGAPWSCVGGTDVLNCPTNVDKRGQKQPFRTDKWASSETNEPNYVSLACYGSCRDMC